MKFTTSVVLSLISLAAVSTASPIPLASEAETSIVERDVEVNVEDSGVIARDVEDGFEEDLELRGGSMSKAAKQGLSYGVGQTWSNGATDAYRSSKRTPMSPRLRTQGIQPTIAKLNTGSRRPVPKVSAFKGPSATRRRRDLEDAEELEARGGSMSKAAKQGLSYGVGQTWSNGATDAYRSSKRTPMSPRLRTQGIQPTIAKLNTGSRRPVPKVSAFKGPSATRRRRDLEDAEDLEARGGSMSKAAKQGLSYGAGQTWSNGATDAYRSSKRTPMKPSLRTPGIQPTIAKLNTGSRRPVPKPSAFRPPSAGRIGRRK